MSRKRSAEEAPVTEPQAKRGAVPGSSDRPLETPPFAATPPGSTTAATSSTASGGARRAAPPLAAESSMKESTPPPERMVAGAGARTVAARIMGRGGGAEDSSGSATMTQGGGGPRRGQSDEEDGSSSSSEGSAGGGCPGVPVAVELTPEELARRRGARLARLLRLYRVQYWGLCQEMRAKHRRFFLRQGSSGWRDEGGGATEGPLRSLCSKAGCQDWAMAASSFCFRHILCDPRQQLYCACIHSPTPDEPCPRPVLRAVVPSLCGQHAALRKANQSPRARPSSAGSSAGGATSSSSMLPVPPVHVLMNEYIRVLQRHRTVTAAMKQEPKT